MSGDSSYSQTLCLSYFIFICWFKLAVGSKCLGTVDTFVYFSCVCVCLVFSCCVYVLRALFWARVSQDTPLARMYAGMRTLRLADGPDEVHRRTIARIELSKHQAARVTNIE